jgi:integrase
VRVRNVDLIHRRIRVVEAVTEINGRLVVGSPRTHQERTVPVPAFVADMLAEHLAGASPGGLAFTSPRGETLRVGNFRRGWFDPATAVVGMEGLVPHELRHTAASLAIAAGASVKGVQTMLGHASATLMLDLYGHLFPDELEGVAERLNVAAARSAEDSLRTKRGSRVVKLASRRAKIGLWPALLCAPPATAPSAQQCPRQDSNLRRTV